MTHELVLVICDDVQEFQNLILTASFTFFVPVFDGRGLTGFFTTETLSSTELPRSSSAECFLWATEFQQSLRRLSPALVIIPSILEISFLLGLEREIRRHEHRRFRVFARCSFSSEDVSAFFLQWKHFMPIVRSIFMGSDDGVPYRVASSRASCIGVSTKATVPH